MKIPTRNEIVTALVTYRAMGEGKPPSVAGLATPEQVAQYLAEAERGLRNIEAEAWDEGYQEANQDLWRDGGREGNPYQKAVQPE